MSLPICLCVRHSADGEGVEGKHVRRAELAQELSSLQLAIAQLEADAGRLQNDITKKGVGCFLIAKTEPEMSYRGGGGYAGISSHVHVCQQCIVRGWG